MRQQLDDGSSEWMVHSEIGDQIRFQMDRMGVHDMSSMGVEVFGMSPMTRAMINPNGMAIQSSRQECAAASKAAHNYGGRRVPVQCESD